MYMYVISACGHELVVDVFACTHVVPKVSEPEVHLSVEIFCVQTFAF